MQKNTGRLLKIACNQMVRNLDRFAEQFDLTGTQMSIIDFLRFNAEKEMLQSDIEKEFSIQRSTATILLQRMEKKHLIYRKSSSKDARQKFVYLTPWANELSKHVAEYMQLQQEELEKTFSKEEMQIFEKVLYYYMKK